MTDVHRPTRNSDGVTDRWYESASVSYRATDIALIPGNYEYMNIAFASFRRTTRPLNDRKTTYPDLP